MPLRNFSPRALPWWLLLLAAIGLYVIGFQLGGLIASALYSFGFLLLIRTGFSLARSVGRRNSATKREPRTRP